MVIIKCNESFRNYLLLITISIVIILKSLKFWNPIDLLVYNALPVTNSIYLQFFTETASLYGSLMVLALIMFFIFNREKMMNTSFMIELLAGFILTNLVIGLLKHTFEYPRPNEVAISLFPSTMTSIDTYSFPSGHASRAGYLAGLIEKITNKKILKIIAYMYTILICLSRLLLGVHWLSDVIAGSLIGYYIGLTFHIPKKLLLRVHSLILKTLP